MGGLITEARILRVDLSTGTIKKETVDPGLVRKYLGGRGLATKLLADSGGAKVDALSPANKLIFAPGLLAGTTAPTGGRYMVVTKSPLTGTVASSNAGGFFGAELKKAGWSMVIIEGASNTPVYLSIHDDKVELHHAAHLWGKDTHATTNAVVAACGEGVHVACIGPAGENLSLIAAVINDKHRAAGRSGVGAVMGSKKLKAIAVRGSTLPTVANEAEFRQTVKRQVEMLRKNAITGEALPALGTKVLDSIINANGLYPTNNFQLGTFASIDEVNGEALVNKQYLKRKKACFACTIACGRSAELPDGSKGEGPEYETGWAFGACCGVKDLIAISKANFLCNELGLDTISAGVTIATVMELYENGHIPRADLRNAVEPRFGSSEAIIYYTRAMAFREGLGAAMADGSHRLATSYGHPELSMTVKKQEIPAYDPRGVQGQALQYATSNRGGCHVRGYLISPEILGVPEKLDPQSLDGKAAWVKTFQDLTAVIDSAGLCLFTSFALTANDYSELINAATGFNFTVDELMKTGERIWNLERQFNLAAGISPAEDTLPKRFLDDPMPDGPQKGAVAKLAALLPEYYKVRGWAPDGIASRAKLDELAL